MIFEADVLHRARVLVRAIALATMAAGFRPALAQTIEAGEPNLPVARLSWDCQLIRELDAFIVRHGELTLNNFSMKSDTGLMSGRPYAELSFSLVNRAASPAFPTVQVALYDSRMDMATLALSLQPMFSMIDANSAEQLTESVNIRQGELTTIGRVCVRVDG